MHSNFGPRLLSFSMLALAPAMLACPAKDAEKGSEKSPSAAASDAHAHAQPASPASQPAQTASKAATLGKGESAQEREQTDDDGVVRRGVVLSSAAPLTVADCAAQAAELDGKPVKIEGEVEKVCAAKGCWWVLKGSGDDAPSVRITAKGYGFFVPKDAAGRRAVAEGVLEVKDMSEAEARHLAEDEGKPAEAATAQRELRLEASAIEMHPVS